MNHYQVTKKSVKQSSLISVKKKKSKSSTQQKKDTSLKVQIKKLEP